MVLLLRLSAELVSARQVGRQGTYLGSATDMFRRLMEFSRLSLLFALSLALVSVLVIAAECVRATEFVLRKVLEHNRNVLAGVPAFLVLTGDSDARDVVISALSRRGRLLSRRAAGTVGQRVFRRRRGDRPARRTVRWRGPVQGSHA